MVLKANSTAVMASTAGNQGNTVAKASEVRLMPAWSGSTPT